MRSTRLASHAYRLWKAEAAAHIGTKTPREAAALDYSNKLKQRFRHHPDIKRIARYAAMMGVS